MSDRLREVVEGLTSALRDRIRELEITEEELLEGLRFLTEVGKREEFILLSDALRVSVLVDAITHGDSEDVTPSNVEGPFYRPGAPELSPPYDLVRDDAEGEWLVVSGRVVASETREGLADAVLDVWQADPRGLYDSQYEGEEFRLRGRIRTDERGGYEFQTVVPPPYEIPKDGPVGRLLRALGRHAFRPAHIHFKVTREGYEPLTTMVFFEGDPWLDSDVIGAVKGPLVAKVAPRDDDDGGSALGCRFDFALRAAS